MKTTLVSLLLAACVLVTHPAQAIRPGKPVTTAEWVCFFRALAAQHPDPKLRNPDHLAEKLCWWPTDFPQNYADARQFMDRHGDAYAAYFVINARTHHIDAALKRAAADGATQVVILGAGFDSRAYRFRQAYPQLRFFEVDLPNTSKQKRTALAGHFGAVPDYVRYAPIDFDKQKLGDVLPKLGYERKKKTLFIFEGVTMYVAEAGNAETLKFIRAHSAPGSRVIYDYLLRDVAEKRYGNYYAAQRIANSVAMRGEPYVTGWTPEEAAAFAKKQGLVVVEDVGHKELVERYLTGSDGKVDGRLLEWQRILEAKVP